MVALATAVATPEAGAVVGEATRAGLTAAGGVFSNISTLGSDDSKGGTLLEPEASCEGDVAPLVGAEAASLHILVTLESVLSWEMVWMCPESRRAISRCVCSSISCWILEVARIFCVLPRVPFPADGAAAMVTLPFLHDVGVAGDAARSSP